MKSFSAVRTARNTQKGAIRMPGITSVMPQKPSARLDKRQIDIVSKDYTGD